MARHQIESTPFARLYPLYVAKAERKKRSRAEVDTILVWLTGYDSAGLKSQMDQGKTVKEFFDESPAFNPSAALIKGVVCGVRVEDIEDPLTQRIRWLDKLIDELAKGKAMEKILRGCET